MGALRVGDRLFDERGETCHVMLATEVMLGRPCNLVEFSDGLSVVADDDHVWMVNDGSGDEGRCATRSTADIAKRIHGVPGYRCLIPACLALRMPEAAELEDPYRTGQLALLRGSLQFADVIRAGSVLQRRRLLRGVIDCMGGRRRDRWYRLFCPTVKLMHDLLDLLRSLGQIPTSDEGWVIWSRSKGVAARQITSIEPTSSVPVRCIQVNSPSRLYLCGRAMVPTHNTFLMAEEIRRAARLAIQSNVGVENEIWYGAPTFLQAKRVMWGRLKKVIPARWLDGRPNETSCVMRLRSGHVLRLVGLDAFENLRGSGLWFFGGDEWADCRPEAWAEVVRPMLSTSRGHALFIGTPKGFDHFRDAYLLGQPGGDPSYRSFLYTTLDGGNVPPDEVAAACAFR